MSSISLDNLNAHIDQRIDQYVSAYVLEKLYPIGALYWSQSSTNPESLIGGSWAQVKDRFILAAGDTYAANTTGGSAAVTLTLEQVPPHNHIANVDNAGDHNHPFYTQNDDYNNSAGGGLGLTHDGSPNWIDQGTNYVRNAGTHTHTVTINTVGGGQSHDNMPPYIAMYCWKRVA